MHTHSEDSKKEAKNIAQLEAFSHQIFESKSSEDIKADVHKNVQCWIYISQNPKFIKDAVDDWVQYPTGQKSKANSQYYPHARDKEHDKKSGLLRTPAGLSFHIEDYKDGTAAVTALNNHIAQVVSALKQLSPEDRLVFGLMLEWNEQVGCMEARSERALAWASRKLAGMTPLIKDIFTEVSAYYDQSSKGKSFLDFAEEYCRIKKYTECVDEDQQQKSITKDLLKQYAILIGKIDEENKDDSKRKFSELETQYKALTQSATIVMGQTKMMIQHRFADEKQTGEFLLWVKQQKLPLINKASVTEEKFNGKINYVVRLSNEQLKLISEEQLRLLKYSKPAAATVAPTIIISTPTPVAVLVPAPKSASPPQAPPETKVPVIQSVSVSRLSAIQIKNVWEDIKTAINKNDTRRIQEIMSRLSEEDKIKVLNFTDPDGCNILNHAVGGGESTFMTLFDLFPVKERNQALFVQENYSGCTVWHRIGWSKTSILQQIMDKTDKNILRNALLSQNKSKTTVFQVIASSQPPDVFEKLIDYCSSVDADFLNQACHLYVHDQFNVPFRDHPILEKLFNTIDDSALSALFNMSEISNYSLKWMAAYVENKPKQIESVSNRLQALIAASKIKPSYFSDLIQKAKIDRVWGELNKAILEDDVEKITTLMRGVSEQEQEKIFLLSILDYNSRYEIDLLELAAMYAKKSFTTLLDLLPEKIRNLAISGENFPGNRKYSGKSTLHIAAEFQSDDAFRHLVEKTNEKMLSEILPWIYHDNKLSRYTLLHMVLLHKSVDSICMLVDKTSVKAISTALVMQDYDGRTPLYLSAATQVRGSFGKLIARSHPHALDKACRLYTTAGRSVLEAAILTQSPEDIANLLKKVSYETVKIMLKAPNIPLDLLTTMLGYFSSEPSWKIEPIVSYKKIISAALCSQDAEGRTPLYMAALGEIGDSSFGKLVALSDPDVLEKACCLYTKSGHSIPHAAITTRSPEDIATLLRRVSYETVKKMFTLPTHSPYLTSAIARYIGSEPSWQTEPIVSYFFTLDGPNLTSHCIALWKAGKSLPPILIKAAIPHFKKLIQNEPEKASELEGVLASFNKIISGKEIESKEGIVSIRLKSGKTLALSKDSITEQKASEIIWKEGLLSYHDYYLIKNHFPNSVIAQTVDDLYNANLLFKGCYLLFEPTVVDSKLAQTSAKGEVLLKIIHPDDWPEFKRQISDYTYRADLRDKKKDRSTAKDKYVHSKGKTLSEMGIEYEDHTKKKKEKEHKHTIKQSTTLVTSDYRTAVFGEHDPDRRLVGLLFSKEHCIIKAKLLRDTHTYAREWVGSKEEVAAYAQMMKKLNYTSFEEFKKDIEKNPQRTNEILAKLSREAMLGVVMARDTPDMRKQARMYQADLKAKTGIDLPIYFYNRAVNNMTLYTPREQQDDIYAEQHKQPGYNSIRALDKVERAKFSQAFSEKLNVVMPRDKEGFITLLVNYIEVEKSKLAEPRHWYQVWRLSTISSETNQAAAQTMIDLLQGEKPQIPLRIFDAFKSSNDLAKIIAGMRNKNILPEEFKKQERVQAISARREL